MLDYPHFEENYKMIAIDFSRKQALDADLKEIQQISFTANLDRGGNTTMIFIIEEVKETERKRKRLFTRNCKRFVNLL